MVKKAWTMLAMLVIECRCIRMVWQPPKIQATPCNRGLAVPCSPSLVTWDHGCKMTGRNPSVFAMNFLPRCPVKLGRKLRWTKTSAEIMMVRLSHGPWTHGPSFTSFNQSWETWLSPKIISIFVSQIWRVLWDEAPITFHSGKPGKTMEKPQQKTIVDLPRDSPIPTRLQHHPCQATTVPIQLSWDRWRKSFSICLPWSDLHRWSIFNCPGCWTNDVYVICLLFFRLQLVYPFWSCQKYSQSHRSNPGSGLDAPSLSSLVGSHSIWFAFCALKLLNLSKHLPA